MTVHCVLPLLWTPQKPVLTNCAGLCTIKSVNGNSLPTWTPFNFEGFYYNIDEGIGTEELKVEQLGRQ